MKAADLTVDARGEAVSLPYLIVAVPGDVQRLRNERPLKRDVLRLTRAKRFVHAPTDRAVIVDAVVRGREPHAVHRLPGDGAHARADEPQHDILRADQPKGIVAHHDP